MDDFWSHPQVRLSSTRHHGTKRGGNGGSPELSVRKRHRSSVDISSLSPSQVATLSEAAAILQVDIADLPDALCNPSQRLELVNRSQVIPEAEVVSQQQLPFMEGRRFGSRILTQASNPTSKLSSEFNSATEDSLAIHDICEIPSFSLGLMHKQVADCFADFKSSTSRPALPVESQGDMSIYDAGMITNDSSLSIQNSSNQLSSSSLGYDMPPSGASTGINVFDVIDDFSIDASYSLYDCDTFAPNIQEWMASNGQPHMPQRMQPYISPQPMVYPLGDGDKFEEDLISFSGDLGFSKTRNCSNVPGQIDSLAHLDMSPVNQSKQQTPDLEASQTMQQLNATPRRKFQSTHHREKTAQTRKLTACVRCRMQRIRCDPDPANPRGVCLTCQKVMKPTLHKLPCLRYKVTDVRLFRDGSYAAGRDWSHRWSSNSMENITHWASSELKSIQVTQDYGPSALTFTVRQFIPVKGDMLHRQWSDGAVTKSVAVPNYAIVDMAAALQVHKDFIINEGPHFFKTALDYNDRLLWDTYSTAIWFSNSAKSLEEREVLQMVLQLWVTIRMRMRSVRISSSETLGMPSDLMDKSSGMYGKIPIPPVMGAQMQFILNHKLLAPLRSKILVRLQKLTLDQKPDNWFCIYLCTFILLHNCSLLTDHDVGYACKHGLKARHARPDMIRELHLGANVLLAHFHYGCKGHRPFTLDWKPELSTSMATLDDKQLRFVRQTAVYVEHNGPRFKKLLSEGINDSEHYFVAQMYEEEWKPKVSVE